ncbi:unnamed protein product, partial [marine sediment metagenome]
KIISVDMFWTLADVDTRKYEVKSLLELLPILGLKGDPNISDNPKIY